MCWSASALHPIRSNSVHFPSAILRLARSDRFPAGAQEGASMRCRYAVRRGSKHGVAARRQALQGYELQPHEPHEPHEPKCRRAPHPWQLRSGNVESPGMPVLRRRAARSGQPWSRHHQKTGRMLGGMGDSTPSRSGFTGRRDWTDGETGEWSVAAGLFLPRVRVSPRGSAPSTPSGRRRASMPVIETEGTGRSDCANDGAAPALASPPRDA